MSVLPSRICHLGSNSWIVGNPEVMTRPTLGSECVVIRPQSRIDSAESPVNKTRLFSHNRILSLLGGPVSALRFHLAKFVKQVNHPLCQKPVGFDSTKTLCFSWRFWVNLSSVNRMILTR